MRMPKAMYSEKSNLEKANHFVTFPCFYLQGGFTEWKERADSSQIE